MTTHATTRPRRTLAQRISSAFVAITDHLAENSHAMRCAREAEELMRLSDAELAARGLTRNTVYRYAFRGYLPS